MPSKPSFLRDPDQAAELAALLQDTADTLEARFNDDSKQAGGLTRAEAVSRAQTIARYRRWAGELVAPEPEAAAPAPLLIRPKREDQNTEATG